MKTKPVKKTEKQTDSQNAEPIKVAFSSSQIEGRTFLLYRDGSVKIIEQFTDDGRPIIVWLTSKEIEKINALMNKPG